jgi:hypothetical protein
MTMVALSLARTMTDADAVWRSLASTENAVQRNSTNTSMWTAACQSRQTKVRDRAECEDGEDGEEPPLMS